MGVEHARQFANNLPVHILSFAPSQPRKGYRARGSPSLRFLLNLPRYCRLCRVTRAVKCNRAAGRRWWLARGRVVEASCQNVDSGVARLSQTSRSAKHRRCASTLAGIARNEPQAGEVWRAGTTEVLRSYPPKLDLFGCNTLHRSSSDRTYNSSQTNMQALRSSTRFASRFQSAGSPKLVRSFAAGTYEHLLVSTPKPGVGFSKFL
jgi:hypothetical protein